MFSGVRQHQQRGWIVCVAAAIGVCGAASAQPHANVPLPIPYFSIDIPSPSIGGPNNLHADDVLQVPGPTQAVFNVSMNLGRPGDELDGLSDARSVPPVGTFTLLFSVDRASMGAVPPDPSIVAMGFPYNVQHQAHRNQAAGDLFMTTQLFDISGALPLTRAIQNNTMVINQGDAGGVDFQLDPPISPDDPWGGPIDDLDGVGYLPAGAILGTQSLYFSLGRGSPSLGVLPGPNSPASVFFDSNTSSPGNEQLYLSGSEIGLPFPSDDLDALVIFDNGNQVFNQGIDIVLFSLRRNSQSLFQSGLSSADVLISSGGGVFELYAAASELGLLPTDELDALELLNCTDITVCINDHAIFPEPSSLVLLLTAALPFLRRRTTR